MTDWGLGANNEAANDLISLLTLLDRQGKRLDIGQLQPLIKRLVPLILTGSPGAEALEQAFIWYLTGKDTTSSQASRLCPFMPRATLKDMISDEKARHMGFLS